MGQMVTISLEEYAQLQDDHAWRVALEAGGVDNWEWYSESLSDGGYFDEEEEE